MLARQQEPLVTVRPTPGPKGNLLLGNTVDFQRDPLTFLKAANAQYGDVVRFRVAWTNWYLLTHPDHIWDVTVTRASAFHKPKVAKVLWSDFLGNGLLSADGDFWKRQHRMIVPGFHRARIHAYGEVMVRYTHELIDTWSDGEDIDVVDAMTALTLRVVAKTLFDAEVSTDASTVGHAMEVLNEALCAHINNPLPVPSWWPSTRNKRKLQAIADVEQIVQRIIDERRRTGEDHGDLLSMLVLAEADDGARMTDRELRDEAMTLVFAGHETTAIALTWMWYLMAQHPDVAERVRHEVADAVGDRPLSVSDLEALPYLEMVVKECMRFLPSVWAFMREPVEDIQVGEHMLERGAHILICPYLTHHDARWFEDPSAFRPERFEPTKEKALPKGAYVPFSAGPRVWLGKAFAMMEAKLVLGTMLQRVRPRVAEGYQLELLAQLSLRPKNGLPAAVELVSP